MWLNSAKTLIFGHFLHMSCLCHNEIVTNLVQTEQPIPFPALPLFQISATLFPQIHKLRAENITNRPSATSKMHQETAY